MITQGFELMVVGMAVVFLFLAALVTTLSISALIFAHFSTTRESDTASPALAIAIAAAYDKDSQRSGHDA